MKKLMLSLSMVVLFSVGAAQAQHAGPGATDDSDSGSKSGRMGEQPDTQRPAKRGDPRDLRDAGNPPVPTTLPGSGIPRNENTRIKPDTAPEGH
jgi:hypothetical protein